MYKFIIYLEVLVLATIYRIVSIPINAIVKELALLGRTAETYSKFRCHFWQQRKVLHLYNKAYEYAMKKAMKEKE